MSKEPTVYDVTYCALDYETTGLNPHRHEVVEVAAVRFNLLDKREKIFCHLVKPRTRIPKDATAIHGITNEMVARQPSFREMRVLIQDFIGESVVVAHNIGFERRFSRGIIDNNRQADTYFLSRKWLQSENYRLSTLVEGNGSWHRALPDAIACKDLFKDLVETIKKRTGSVALREVLS